MPARLRLSWGMKTLKPFLLPVLEFLEFGRQVIHYALIFVSVFFRQRASLGCESVAIRSQLTFYEESIRQKRQPRPRFHPAFRLLWVLLSSVWTGWKSAAELMKRCSSGMSMPFQNGGAGNLDAKEAVKPSARKCER